MPRETKPETSPEVNGHARVRKVRQARPRRLPGIIRAGAVYTIDEFKERTGLKDRAMRHARRAGLIVRYVGGRGFIKGEHFLAFLDAQDAKREEAD